jgi:hypothetical protein
MDYLVVPMLWIVKCLFNHPEFLLKTDVDQTWIKSEYSSWVLSVP